MKDENTASSACSKQKRTLRVLMSQFEKSFDLNIRNQNVETDLR